MSIRRGASTIPVALAAALLFGASTIVAPPPNVDGATPALKGTVCCYSTKERTVIKNQSSRRVTLKSVGSIYKPYSSEPFAVSKALAPGKTVSYYKGSGASSSHARTLTRQSIYNDSVGTSEGARVKTKAGKVLHGSLLGRRRGDTPLTSAAARPYGPRDGRLPSS